jgi:hypothetical protein
MRANSVVIREGMGGIKTGRGNRLWNREYLYAKPLKICMF